MPKLINQAGQAVYLNNVMKRNKMVWVIKAASGQVITGRDKQKRASRSFSQLHQAAAWLDNHGYETTIY